LADSDAEGDGGADDGDSESSQSDDGGTDEWAFRLSSTPYLSDPVDPFGCLRYACGLLAESRCLLPRAPRPAVPRTRPASGSFEAVHTGTGDLLSSCDLVASMQTHRSPSRHGRWCIMCIRARQELMRWPIHAYACFRQDAVAGHSRVAGLLGTWRCPFVLCAYRTWTTAFHVLSEVLSCSVCRGFSCTLEELPAPTWNAHIMFSNQQCTGFRDS
jgi:hypothetical protein